MIPGRLHFLGLCAIAMVGCHGARGRLAEATDEQASAPKHLPPRELKAATVNLNQGMTATQVEALLGAPDTMEGDLCGQRTSRPWKCVTWTYQTDNQYMPLRVVFQDPARNGALVVDHWTTSMY